MSRLTHDKIGQIQQRLTDEGKIPTDELIFERMTAQSDNPLYWMQKAKDYRDMLVDYENDANLYKEHINVLYTLCAFLAFVAFAEAGYLLYRFW